MRGVALILVLTLQLWANVQPTEGSPLQMLRQFWTPFANRQHDLGRSTPRFPRDFEVKTSLYQDLSASRPLYSDRRNVQTARSACHLPPLPIITSDQLLIGRVMPPAG